MERLRTPLTLALATAAALLPTASGAQAPPPPLFAGVWFGGPVDSIYNAEYQRVQAACAGQSDECYASELDTTAVRLAPAYATPGADEPVGWLAARLRPRGRWPYAGLVFLRPGGEQVALLEDLGDWGYGTTLALVEADDGWLRPWLLSAVGPYWLNADGGPGFGLVEGPFGLEGRLWRLGPVDSVSGAALAPGVYMVLAVEGGLARLRAELPEDMECGEPADPGQDRPAPVIHSIPLAALIDPSGRPRVEVAYPKGC